jgi:hypothetical protein
LPLPVSLRQIGFTPDWIYARLERSSSEAKAPPIIGFFKMSAPRKEENDENLGELKLDEGQDKQTLLAVLGFLKKHNLKVFYVQSFMEIG